MSIIRESTAVAAGARIANQVEGSPFEIVPRNQSCQIAMTSDDADLTADIFFGGRLIGQSISIPLASAAGRGPLLNEDMLVNDIILPTERLVISLNGGAGASNVRTLVNLTPL